MIKPEKAILSFTQKANWVSGAAIIAMMLITTLDVFMRFFRNPISGTYETVGLLCSVAVAFSLGYTAIEKGHIAVEFLVRRFSLKIQSLTAIINAIVSILLFTFIAWECIVLGKEYLNKSEVSMTLQMPLYPFIYGIAAGCMLLCPVLIIDFLNALRSYVFYKDAEPD